MRLRRRRYLLLLGSSAGPADRYGTPAFVQPRRRGRVQRFTHLGVVLTVIGLMGVFRVAGSRRRLLPGLAFAGLAVLLRDSMWGLMFLAMFVLYLPPWSPQVA